MLLSEIPTTYDKRSERQVNAGNLLLRGVPGVGKTFFGVILAAISDAKFARIQGRADLQPTEVVGFQMINPATGQLVTEFGPMASAEVILLDEINRIPLKSQSAFLEGLQDRTHHRRQGHLRPAGVQLRHRHDEPGGAGPGHVPAVGSRHRPLRRDGADRLPAAGRGREAGRLRLQADDAAAAAVEGADHRSCAAVIGERVFLHKSLGRYVQRLVGATRPMDPDTDWHQRSPSALVERGVDLGASPRAIICWSRLAKAWALLQGGRAEVYPEDIQALAPFVLGHRIWLGPHAAAHGLTTDAVIADVVAEVPIP